MNGRSGPPEPSDLLGKKNAAARWGLLVLGVGLVGGGVFLIAATKSSAAIWTSLPLFFFGGLLAWLGLHAKNAFRSPEGVRRVGWISEELVPWELVETIELDEVPTRYEPAGWVRLRLTTGRKVNIPAEPADVDELGTLVSDFCPGAFIDDRRTGEVTPPREGDADLIERREAAVRERAARSHFRAGIGWSVAGATLVVSLAASVVMLFISDRTIEVLGALLFCGTGTWVCFRTASLKFRIARAMRESG